MVLACTEVENHCRGILLANSGSTEDERHLNMNEYVVLRGAMKLDEYAIAFPTYPWLEAIAPFKGWGSTAKPSPVGGILTGRGATIAAILNPFGCRQGR